MKIRADFVTNSSSSSFVAYGIYDEEIKEFVLNLLADKVLNEINDSGTYEYDSSCLTVLDSGLSIDSEIGDVEGAMWLKINQVWEEEDYTTAMALGDGRSMMKTPCIVDVLKRFMKGLSSDQEKQLKKLIDQSKKDKLIEDKVYFGATDDPIFDNTFNENSAKKRLANNQKNELLKAKEEEKREKALKINNGLNISNGVLLECKSEEETIAIPYGITKIANKAFMKNKNIVNVELPDSVEYIGEYAFSGCENLISITIPKSVKVIDSYAFNGCKNLIRLDIENGVERIEYSAFSNCKSLTEIKIPESVVYTNRFIFTGCKNLANIIVNSNNKNLYSCGGVLFDKNNTILCYPPAKQGETYEIPNGIEKIEHKAFDNCTNLKEITIPSTVKDMACARYPFEFSNCKKLENIYVNEENDKYCSKDGIVFTKDFTQLLTYPPKKFGESYEIPHNVSRICIRCSSELQNLVITGHIEEFEITSCKKLKTITVPYHFKHWAEKNFEKLKTQIAFCGELPVVEKDNDFKIVNGALVSYKKSRDKVVKIPQGVKRIEEYAFARKFNIEEITLPDSVEFIGERAFSNCSSLKTINIPNDIEYIGSYAFENCYELEKINIPGNPQFKFGFSPFYDSGLKSAEIGYGSKKIARGLFRCCENLEELIIPDTVRIIDENAFFDCSNLKQITLPKRFKESIDQIISNDETEVIYE